MSVDDGNREIDRPKATPKRNLVRPSYITLGPQGQIEEIFCKLCGDKIAGFLGEGYRRRFTYFPDYIEFKFMCNDGSNHVTNLCIKCLSEVSDDPEALQLLHDADVEVLAESVPDIRKMYGKRKAVRISEVSISKGKRL